MLSGIPCAPRSRKTTTTSHQLTTHSPILKLTVTPLLKLSFSSTPVWNPNLSCLLMEPKSEGKLSSTSTLCMTILKQSESSTTKMLTTSETQAPSGRGFMMLLTDIPKMERLIETPSECRCLSRLTCIEDQEV